MKEQIARYSSNITLCFLWPIFMKASQKQSVSLEIVVQGHAFMTLFPPILH